MLCVTPGKSTPASANSAGLACALQPTGAFVDKLQQIMEMLHQYGLYVYDICMFDNIA